MKVTVSKDFMPVSASVVCIAKYLCSMLASLSEERHVSGVAKVLEAAGGSPTEVARRVGTDEKPCKRQDVEYWVKKGYVPPRWAPSVSKAFSVPLYELNPGVYPQDNAA